MNPILYSITETEFTNNGIGILTDAITCTVTEERNGMFELEMQYPMNGIHYENLIQRALILAKPNPVDDAQPFRIYRITRPLNGVVTVYAEHISYDLSGIPVSPFSASNVTEALQKLKQNAAVPCPFEFWTDKSTVATMNVNVPDSIRGLLGGQQGSVLDTYTGEYKFDRFLVRLYNNRGQNRGVSIRYGKNLTELEQEEDCSDVYTGVYPYWRSEETEELVQLPEKIIHVDGTFNFERIKPLDFSQEWQEKPTEEQLRTRAERYIRNNDIGTPKLSLDISFAQLEQTEEYKTLALLERVELCDTVNIYYEKLGVNATAKVIKTVYDVILGRYDSVELGDSHGSIADTIAEQEETVQQAIQENKTTLQRAVDRATQQITGNLGGYVVIRSSTGGKEPDEILVMDEPDVETAVKVWRWNKSGLGYSSHGYNGQYELAMTQNGEIVADFITTGTLTANLIKAGVLQSNDGETFYLDLENGILRMKATSLSISGKTVDDIAQNKANTALNSAKSYADSVAKSAVDNQTQTSIYNKLTNNGQSQGLYMSGGNFYINASYINSGYLSASRIQGGTLYLGGSNNTYGTLIVRNSSGYEIGRWDRNGISVTSGTITSTSGNSQVSISGGVFNLGFQNSNIGYIGTAGWNTNAYIGGIWFALHYGDGDYMAWAAKMSSSSIYYEVKLIYTKNSFDDFVADRIYSERPMQFVNGAYFGNTRNNPSGIIEGVPNSLWLDGTSSSVSISLGYRIGNNGYAYFIADNSYLTAYKDLDMQNHEVINTSDERLKENIEESNVNALDVINSIGMYSFDWVESNEHTDLGFVAQQLEAEVDADFIDISDSDGHYSTKEMKMIPYLVKAIQELSKQVQPVSKTRMNTLQRVNKWEPKHYSHDEKIEFANTVKEKGTREVPAETPSIKLTR